MPATHIWNHRPALSNVTATSIYKHLLQHGAEERKYCSVVIK